MYQPAGYAIIAWISSGFTATLSGIDSNSEVYLPFRFFISSFFMVMAFCMNYLAPKIPVKFNVATTIIRMVPLVLMGTVGVVIGLILGDSNTPKHSLQTTADSGNASLFAAISATAFAFNGWQAALAFNSEVKNSKKKFPVALLTGFFFVTIIYILYFVGIVLASPDGGNLIMLGGGERFAQGTYNAFSNIFGQWASNILIGFMIISGLGILNACCLGMSRAMYSLGRRKLGPLSERMGQLDQMTNVPNNSMVIAVGISFLWLFVIFANTNWFPGWFGTFRFSLPDFYNFCFFALLIPLFFCSLIKHKQLHWFKRVIAPIIAITGAGFMYATYWIGSWIHATIYTSTFVLLAIVGFLLRGKT